MYLSITYAIEMLRVIAGMSTFFRINGSQKLLELWSLNLKKWLVQGFAHFGYTQPIRALLPFHDKP